MYYTEWYLSQDATITRIGRWSEKDEDDYYSKKSRDDEDDDDKDKR